MSVIAEPAYPTPRRKQTSTAAEEHSDSIHLRRSGRARQRQLWRQKRNRWLGGMARVLTSLWLIMGAFFPVIFYGYTSTRAAPSHPASPGRMANKNTSGTVLSIAQPSVTPTPEPQMPTATFYPSPTATQTATPLPPSLIQATAWQATLEQAAAFSYATQTQASGQYAATQTALPPILTANALERAATATAVAK